MPMLTMKTIDEVRKGLTNWDLDPEPILPIVLPCLRCLPTYLPDEDISIGGSKIGGFPDLPENIPWPRWNGEPMAFLGQLALDELQSYPSCRMLPQSGYLSFFCDPLLRACGFSASDYEGCSAIHFENASLARREPPRDFFIPPFSKRSYGAASLKFEEMLSLPDEEDLQALIKDLPTADRYAYGDFLAADLEAQMRPFHQLMGHPDVVQGGMLLQLQDLSAGLDYGSDRTREIKIAPGLGLRRMHKGTVHDWVMLLQVDTDASAEMMWGDCGLVYFWIRRQDLEAGSFGRTWMLLQCC